MLIDWLVDQMRVKFPSDIPHLKGNTKKMYLAYEKEFCKQENDNFNKATGTLKEYYRLIVLHKRYQCLKSVDLLK